jgi:DNA-binding transcriptional LysR family regulator
MIMNLREIAAFVAVADSGSLSKAAHRLNLSQPAVSRRVKAFEEATGNGALLDRTAKPPTLTPLGRAVLEQCRRVLKAVDELGASVASGGGPSGEFRVGVPPGLSDAVLGQPLEEMRRIHPRIRLSVETRWTPSLIEGIRNRSLDFAIALLTQGHSVPAEIERRVLGNDEVVVVAARGAGLARRRRDPYQLRDLADCHWIVNPRGCVYRSALERAFGNLGLPLRLAAEVIDRDLRLALVARQVGLGLVSMRQLEAWPGRRRLARIKLGDFSLRVAITALSGSSLGNLAVVARNLSDRVAQRLSGSIDA